jgi:hypothetical protein
MNASRPEQTLDGIKKCLGQSSHTECHSVVIRPLLVATISRVRDYGRGALSQRTLAVSASRPATGNRGPSRVSSVFGAINPPPAAEALTVILALRWPADGVDYVTPQVTPSSVQLSVYCRF